MVLIAAEPVDIPLDRAAIRGQARPAAGSRWPADRSVRTHSRARAGCWWSWESPQAGEPRLAVGQTGKNAPPILGRDVVDFAPGAVAVLDDRSAIFPIDSLSQLRPGTYAVQALLHRTPT